MEQHEHRQLEIILSTPAAAMDTHVLTHTHDFHCVSQVNLIELTKKRKNIYQQEGEERLGVTLAAIVHWLEENCTRLNDIIPE